ncbi:cytochrome P450 [Streptomyces sp. LaPpAH-108]|uniref:cytochrome P450 n=1 Tax=Streptomyces sp. LaPpAH-108 TaxID=1155714 RepID=UPI00036D1D26|nr:cytochrome P450 [Streptomyces sp. LaPpAH-108]
MKELLVHYDPLAPETIHDPYPTYKAMRELGAPCWNEIMKCWVVTSYDGCKRVLSDYENFAADWRRGGESMPENALSVHSLDPPDSTVIYRELAATLRQVIAPDLSHRLRQAISDRLRTLAGPPVDLVSDFTEPLACWFLSEVLEVPSLDTPEIRSMGGAIHRAMDAGLVPEAFQPGRDAHRKLAALIEAWVASMTPQQPLRTLVDRAAVEGLEGAMTLNSVRTLIANAFTSLPASLGTIVHGFARDPGLLAGTVNEKRLDMAVHEFLRHESPSQGTTRLCVADTVLSGAKIRRGEDVLVLVSAGNRDPAKFDDPDQLRPERWPNQHIAFGHGPHSCSAAMLSRVLLRELVAVLADGSISIRLTGPVTYKPAATIRMRATLPAVVTPAS